MKFSENFKKTTKVVGVGLVCLDIITTGRSLKYYNGGSCGNVMAALSFLGLDSCLTSFSHDDIAWEIMSKNFKKIGISNINLGLSSQKTPRIIEHLNLLNGQYDGHKFLLKCPKCHSDLPKIKLPSEPEVKPFLSYMNKINLLYSDRISPGIKLLRDNANFMNSWTVYEPNSTRNLSAFLTNTLEASIVKFSSEKVSFEIANNIREQASKSKLFLIIQTLGKDGLRFSYRKRGGDFSLWTHLPAQPITNLIDTAGAGDWCTAGTIASLLSLHPHKPKYLTNNIVISALQYGQALSAISCSFIGGQGLIYANTGSELNDKIIDEIKTSALPTIKPTLPAKGKLLKLCSSCLM